MGDAGGAGPVMSYTGAGCGEYAAVTTYQYVGQGCGEFNAVLVPTGTNIWICVIPLGLLALLGLLWLLSQTNTATTTAVLTCGGCLAETCPYVKMHQCEPCLTNPGSAPPGKCGGTNPANGPSECSIAAILENCKTATINGQLCTAIPDPLQVCMEAAGPVGECIIFGDPHIMTFDHKRVDFYTPGEY